MKLLKYIIVAFIQGICEPLPVSSSGHMFLFEHLLNLKEVNMNYEIICNFGSFIAILIIFWKDIIKLVSGFFEFIFKKDKKKKKEFLYCIYVVISTIPLVITTLLFEDKFEKTMLSLGIGLLLTAIALFLVRKFDGKKDDFDFTIKDALIIGLFQGITFIPGISRSGATLVGCLLCKLKRDSALKYTFILYFPVSVGAMVFGLKDLITMPNLTSLLPYYIVGSIVAFGVTLLSYKYLTALIRKGKLVYFSIYCFILSLVILIFLV